MAKNMTRKGLAVGSAAALSLAGLTALPAQALSSTLVTADGDSYVTVAGEVFTLTGSWSNDFANWNNALIEVLNPDGMDVEVEWTDGGANTGTVDLAAADADGTEDVSGTDGTNSTITVTPDAITDIGDVTVLWGIDGDADGTLEAGEVRVSRTITFVDPADVTLTGGITAPAIGDTTVDMTLSMSHNINVTTIDLGNLNLTLEDGVGGDILDDTDGDAATTDEVAIAAAAGDFAVNADEDGFDITLTLALAAAADDEQVLQWTYTVGAESVTSGLASSTTGSTDMTGVAPDLTETDNVRDNNGDTDVRAGYTGNVVVEFVTTDGNDPVAGETFDVVVSDLALVDDTITVNGETLEAGGDDIEFQATSDADGVVTVTLKSDAGTAGDSVTVTVTSVVDATITDDSDVTWAAATIASVANTDATNNAAVVVAADDTKHSLTLWLYDDFGALADDADYRWEIDNGTDVTYRTVSGGKASMSYTLDGANVDFTLEEQDPDNGNWAAEGTTYAIEWIDADAQFAADDADPAWAGGAETELAGAALVAANTNLGGTAPTYADHDVLSGDLVDKAGNVVVGAVTISGAGLAFSSGDSVYTVGSITVNTDNAGAWSVKVYGNVADAYTVTVSSGSYTEDLDFTVNEAAANSETAVNLSVTGNEPGKTMTLSGTVTDDFGNLVAVAQGDFDLDWDGPGYVVGTLPVESTDGTFTFKVLLGANDTIEGTLTVTTAGADGDFSTDGGAAADADDDNVTATLDIAPAAPAADTKVNAGSFKGYVAVYAKGHEGKRLSAKIGNDWVVVESLASNFERIVDFTGAGYTISVRINIDRVLEDTIVVTTK